METIQSLASYPCQFLLAVIYPSALLLIACLILVNCKKAPPRRPSQSTARVVAAHLEYVKRQERAAAERERKASAGIGADKNSDERMDESKEKKNKKKKKKKEMKEKTADAGENLSPTEGAGESKQSTQEPNDANSTTGTAVDDPMNQLENTVRIEMSDDDHTRTSDSSCIDFNNLAEDGEPEVKKSKKSKKRQGKKKTTGDTTAEGTVDPTASPGGAKKTKKEPNLESVDCTAVKSGKKKLKTISDDAAKALKETPTQTHEEPAY